MTPTARQLAFGLVVLATTAKSQVSFMWEPRAPFPGGGLWAAMSFSLDGKGYVLGGFDGSASRSAMWMYDPEVDQWAQRAPMPQARHLAGAFAIAGKGYVVCGLSGTTNHHQTVFEYDPVSNSWATKAPFPGTARYGVFSFAIGDIGYVGTGNTGSGTGPYVSDGYAYDPSTDSWTPIADFPGQPRYGTTSFSTGGMGYVHGGRLASLAFSNDLFAYDAVANTWTPKPAMSGPGRSWAMSMPFEYDAVVACGKDEDDVNLYDAYRYVPSMDLWQPIPDYPGNSGWGGASFAFSNRVFGGLGRRIQQPNAGYFVDWWELVKVDLSSIAEPDRVKLVRVVPNPVVGTETFLRIEGVEILPGHSFEITDDHGRIVQSGRMTLNALISVDGLHPGSYAITIRQTHAVVSSRFVVLR